jgi:hypothetical protein
LSLTSIAGPYDIVPLVTETVIGRLIVMVPSEIVMLVFPVKLVPMPIEVAVNVPDEVGGATVTEAGATVTIVASCVVAVIVPVKPLSATVND